ncbi:hypothetical protein F4778DRAFT_780937 [Xylariomycetidae sp. FL2044]|nr:hypothetical protein F4778DRAFT_780937 [Xylariomycetidae sp. FL2044]
MDNNITAFFSPMLGSGLADEFGKEKDGMSALLIDRVLDARVSDSALMRLPAEILGDIAAYLTHDKSSLANLALVNSDCRQLARSYQFAEVLFDYSPASHALHPDIWNAHEQVADLFEEGAPLEDGREAYQALKIAADVATHDYLTYRASSIASIATAMPNLEVPFAVGPPHTPSVNSLRSLHLDVGFSPELFPGSEGASQGDMGVLHETLLRECAPTLEYLYLDTTRLGMWDPDKRSLKLDNPPIVFPKLQTVRIPFQASMSKSGYRSILEAPLKYLEVPSYSNVEEALSESKSPRQLETFVMKMVSSKLKDAVGRFLARNWRLGKICISEFDPDIIDQVIIPKISSGAFTNLTSLSLHWKHHGITEKDESHNVIIPESSLRAIGRIASLEQLQLTGGMSAGWRCQWKINHDVLRHCLGDLSRLRRLAFCRDGYSTYEDWESEFDVEMYYENLDIPPHRAAKNEARHLRRMMKQAKQYAATMPSLEGIFLGQRPMSIERTRSNDGSMTRFKVKPLTVERDSCETYLDRNVKLCNEKYKYNQTHGTYIQCHPLREAPKEYWKFKTYKCPECTQKEAIENAIRTELDIQYDEIWKLTRQMDCPALLGVFEDKKKEIFRKEDCKEWCEKHEKLVERIYDAVWREELIIQFFEKLFGDSFKKFVKKLINKFIKKQSCLWPSLK